MGDHVLDELRWYHLDGTECVAGWDAEGPELGTCARGGGPVTPCPTVSAIDLGRLGALMGAEIDRLWPQEDNPGYRAQCLAEEAGEVSRAITKRRHASHASDGRCKGNTVDEWTAELDLELAQLVGVAADIAHREGIDLHRSLARCLTVLQGRQAGT